MCFMKKEQRATHLIAMKKKLHFIYFLWIQDKKKKYKRKESSIRSISHLQLIKRVQSARESEA